MRFLLVNSNRMKPVIAPIGLEYLADAISAAGQEVRLVDLCFADDMMRDLERAIRGFSPQAIGITIRNTDDCYFSSQAFFLPGIRDLVRRIRRLTDAWVVLGGVGYSTAPAAILQYCEADYGIAGEGEVGCVALLKAIESGADLFGVPNLVWRDGHAIRQNAWQPVDLGSLAPRPRALADHRRYFAEGGQAGFETKRGCGMDCVYCADPVAKGRATRLRLPADVVAELQALLAQGVDHFHTCDSEFNLPPEHARSLCQAIIEANLGGRVRWYAYCAPVPFDDDLARRFKGAGCAGINFGVDSGTDAVLRRLGRHFTAADLRRTGETCRRHSLPFMYDLLVGGPGETVETVRETIDLVRRVGPDCVGLSIGVRVYEGTPLAAMVRSQGNPATNAALHGARTNNAHFLEPVFYFSPALGLDPREVIGLVRQLVAGDPRFFLPEDSTGHANYNYNENTVLTEAIANGARGAYWDILRKLRAG